MKQLGVWCVLLIFLLAACGGDDETPAPDNPPSDDAPVLMTPARAEEALRAAFTGDFDTANPYFCSAEQFDDSAASLYGGAEVNSMSCAESGELRITCNYSLTVPTAGGSTTQLTESISYAVEDTVLCSDEIPSDPE